jgi:hypothetical protein
MFAGQFPILMHSSIIIVLKRLLSRAEKGMAWNIAIQVLERVILERKRARKH